MKYKFRELPHKCRGCVWLKEADKGHYLCSRFDCPNEVSTNSAKSAGAVHDNSVQQESK